MKKKEKEFLKKIEEFKEKYIYVLEFVISYNEKYGINSNDTKKFSQEWAKLKNPSQNEFWIEYIRDTLLGNIHISLKRLENIIFSKVKYLKNPKYLISNIEIDPFSFISLDENLITFNQAYEIIKLKQLTYSPTEIIKKWFIYMIVHKNSFYLDKYNIDYEWNKCNIDDKDKYYELLFQSLKEIKTENKKILYTLTDCMQLERKLGDKFINLFPQEDSNDVDIEKQKQLINIFQEKEKITLTEQQKQAVLGMLNNKFYVVTGYPGTGKSTIVKCALFIQNEIENLHISLVAPTGLAIKNLLDKCKHYNKQICGTMHKMIYGTYQKILNPKSEKDQELVKHTPTINWIIVDEISMVNIFLFKNLITMCASFNCKLTLIGDQHQLPPIGCGKPFISILNSNEYEKMELTDIKRQNGKLSKNIKKINRDKLSKKDFDKETIEFIDCTFSNDREFFEQVLSIKKMYKDNKIHYLTPQHGNTGGVSNVNRLLKKLNNPKGVWINDDYNEDDLVIRTENDYSDEDNILVNGDYGYLRRKNKEIVVEYVTGQTEHVTDKILRDSFMHFWCSTIHKMQGSQDEIIVLLMDPSHSMWNYNEDKKNLLYTAISRCTKKCIILGKWDTFLLAQRSVKSNFYTLFMKEFQDPETGDIYTHEESDEDIE